MKSLIPTLALALCAFALAIAPVEAKKKPQSDDQQQQQEQPQSEAPPRYTPFPHNIIFNLVDIDGKAPLKEMWLRIDSTGRANGSSGCKNWSGVFMVGPDRLGPRAMPTFTESACDPGQKTYEQQFWAILLNGPFWDLKGDQLIIKAFKGPGVMHFQRSL
jgi:heat shock protein HslJ